MNNISFIGMAGCGKSTLGKAISEKYSLSFVDTDHLIESEYKMSLENVMYQWQLPLTATQDHLQYARFVLL